MDNEKIGKQSHAASKPSRDHRPDPLLVIPANIPMALSKIPRWNIWRYEWSSGRWCKPPRMTADPKSYASVDTPSDWCSFESAANAYRPSGADGIGLLLPDGPDQYGYHLVAVDLDRCLDAAGDVCSPLALDVLSVLPTYCERSPSGFGLRLFAYGELPRPIMKIPGLELYQSGAYVTVTGQTFSPTPYGVRVCDTGIEWIVRKYFPTKPVVPYSNPRETSSNISDYELAEMIGNSKHCTEYWSLYRGEITEGKSASEADFSLCKILAFWVGNDVGRIMDIWSKSQLGERAKEKGETYMRRTAEKAIAKTPARHDPAHNKRGVKSKSPPVPGSSLPAQGGQGDGIGKGTGAVASGDDERLTDDYALTDSGNGHRFAAAYAERLLWCQERDRWLIWDGVRYAPDDDLEIENLARELSEQLTTLAWRNYCIVQGKADPQDGVCKGKPQSEEDCDKADKRHKFFLGLQSTGKQSSMLQMGRSEPKLKVRNKVLDTHHELLNCSNGTLELTSGKLRPCSEADLLTQHCPHLYDDEARCPQFLRFLDSIFPAEGDASETSGDAEIIDYLQRLCGYWLTGYTHEQQVAFFTGSGRNGKGVLTEVLAAVIGPDYSVAAPPNLLLTSKLDRHPVELHRIRGKRFVYASEVDEGAFLDEAKLKKLTGQDKISSRDLYGSFEDWDNTSKIVLSMNNKPRLRTGGASMARRLQVLKFPVQFWDGSIPAKPGEERPKRTKLNNKLREQLLTESEGILAWCVRGCLEWHKMGLQPPSRIFLAVEEYLGEEDSFGQWVEECCTIDKTREEATAFDALYLSYRAWAEKYNAYQMRHRGFAAKLATLGLAKYKASVMYYSGIFLASAPS